MDSKTLRQKYLDFFVSKGHKIIPPAPLVPENDPTTLFTSSGMQPLIPYLSGQPHPQGKRLTNSQPSFRAQDIDEVGDNRHTTFFEMLGNWSLGDYFKKEQLSWFWEFLTKELGLSKEKLYVTVFEGNESVPKDNESAEIWKSLGVPEDHIFYYGVKKNWWSRSGTPEEMPAGEIGGPDSEVFYEFAQIEHDKKYGEKCHPNCDCGKFLEIGNSVFIQYKKRADGKLEELPQKNVDFGGGVERLTSATLNESDIFKTDLFTLILESIEEISGKKYSENLFGFRVIADHLRAATFILAEEVRPSNVGQGYVLRRLIRRAIRYGKQLDINTAFTTIIAEVVIDLMGDLYPQLKENEKNILEQLSAEEEKFKKTLAEGLKKTQQIFNNKISIDAENYSKIMQIPDKKEVFREIYQGQVQTLSKLGIPLTEEDVKNATISGKESFDLFQSFGFPIEMIVELAQEKNLLVDIEGYREELKKHQELSRTASAGMFKGGLADHSEVVTKYHTATHLLHASLRQILGTQVQQKGSNITSERLRFDFSHPAKVSEEEIKKVEDLVNEIINEELLVTREEMGKDEAIKSGALAFFGERYGEKVTVYTIGPSTGSGSPFSREICGGPHVENTKELGNFKIIKEESAGAGIRRIYATLLS